MRKRISITVVAVLASLALLIPSGSAQAWQHRAGSPFCSTNNGPITLPPGGKCGFWPLNTAGFNVWFTSGKPPGVAWSGYVCAGITNRSGQAIGDNYQVGNQYWNCVRPYSYYVARDVNNVFDSVYGQATIWNLSNWPLKMGYSTVNSPGLPKCGGWLDPRSNDCVWYYW